MIKLFSKENIKMTEGHWLANLLKFAIPLMLTSILITAFNVSDLIVCNLFGSNVSSAAISSTNSLSNVLTGLVLGLATGTNILVSRCYGSNDTERVKKVIGTSLCLSIIIGLAIAIIGVIFSKYFLILMQTPEEILDKATLYMRIIFAGIPFLLVFSFIQAIYRGIGKNVKPMILLVSTGLLNVIMNLVFVIAFKWDVMGVALATILSEAITLIIGGIMFAKEKGFIHISIKDLKMNKTDAKEITLIGIPAGIESALFAISNVFIQAKINTFGTSVIAGRGASGQIDNFFSAVVSGFTTGIATFVSANYGANKLENAKPIRKTAIYAMLICHAVLLLLVFVIRVPLFSLFVQDDAGVKAAIQTFLTITTPYFIYGLSLAFSANLRGYNHSFLASLGMLVSIIPIRLIWIYGICSIPAMNTFEIVLLAYPISYFISLIAEVIINAKKHCLGSTAFYKES